ncbi:MAG: DUF5020 family protein [Bacteroidales bacterium]|nr:DUF5020 family protein [Bacteroidales bacterium]
MKKLIITAAVLLCSFAAFGQTNFQTFYDFGRKHFTTTLEGFHTDNWGNTFFFIDYDYNYREGNTVVSPNNTYFEIARCLNFWQNSSLSPLSLQLEYNGGFGVTSDMIFAFPVNSAFLVGADWFMHSSDFKNTLNLKLLFKQFVHLRSQVPLQFTAVWGCQDLFGAPGLRFSGFLDVWCEQSHTVVLSEPQLWYNFGTEHFNLGGEVELSYNFAGMDGFHVLPCLGMKWVF